MKKKGKLKLKIYDHYRLILLNWLITILGVACLLIIAMSIKKKNHYQI